MKSPQQAFDDILSNNPNDEVLASLEFMIVLIEVTANKRFIDQFNRLHNVKLICENPPKNPIDVLIDEATGYHGVTVDESAFAVFVEFVRNEVYGSLSEDAMQEVKKTADRMRIQAK